MLINTFMLLGVGSTSVVAGSVLLLGGEVESLFSPAIAEVEGYGACGPFDAGVPDLPRTLREFAAEKLDNSIVACGGYGIIGTLKDCYSLDLDESTLVWSAFPPLVHGRHSHGMVNVNGTLFVVGGSSFVGSVRFIERFNAETNAWEEYDEMSGFREDFCVVPGPDGFYVLGGYDQTGGQTSAEYYNVANKTWKQLARLNLGRGLHACSWHQGWIAVAGGWVEEAGQQIPSKSVELYDPQNDIWTEHVSLRHRRTNFGLVSLDNILYAIGGWEGDYLDTIEFFSNETASWDNDAKLLSQKKSAFAVVDTSNVFQEIEC